MRGAKEAAPLTRCRFIAISADLVPPRRDLGLISSTSSAETPSDFPTACHVLGSYLMSEGNQAQSDAISDFPTACDVLGAHFGWSSHSNQSQSDPIISNH